MKTFLFTLFTGFISLASMAQSLIAVESGATTTFFSNLGDAITAAVDGDVVYLPGGSFTPSSSVLVIDKNIDLIGVGHYPDSTLATGQTIINGSVSIRTGADGGSIQGLYIIGSVVFGSDVANQIVNGFSISRCYVSQSFNLAYDASSANSSTQNINISENVIIGVAHFADATNLNISKNIFQSYVRRTTTQAVFSNNVFLQQSNYTCSSTPTFHDINGSIFNNNIITNIGCNGVYTGSFSGNAFNNNIFSANVSFPLGGNPGTGNLVSQALADIFVNQPSGAFGYNYDLHLLSTSPGVNAGTDGTDIGLFGTSFPYKAGAVPANPHISQKVIAPQTNSQGELNINITVGAQEY